MRTYGSGRKSGQQRVVNIYFEGTAEEFVRLSDELERLAELADGKGSPALAEVARQINYWSGNQVDYPTPTGQIQI